jgi:hypothetical protein
MEGSGAGSGSLTNGTGSRRFKNMRIRIPNTGSFVQGLDLGDPHKNLDSTVLQDRRNVSVNQKFKDILYIT